MITTYPNIFTSQKVKLNIQLVFYLLPGEILPVVCSQLSEKDNNINAGQYEPNDSYDCSNGEPDGQSSKLDAGVFVSMIPTI